MRRVAIFLVRCYQRVLRPLLPQTCRFEPTCSAYAIEAFERKGFFRGLALTAWRLARCNPWSRGGYDPVERSAAGREKRGSHAEVAEGAERAEKRGGRTRDP